MVVSLEEAKKAVGLESPAFDRPPVVETALGLRFGPVQGFNVVHFGQLLDKYVQLYPKFQLKPPIGSMLQLNFTAVDETFNTPARCWYINSDDTQLVQVQSDLFIRNWRATSDHPDYQHYSKIRPLFARDWQMFCDFLQARQLSRPAIWQCEVSYINHLVRGRDWETFEDVGILFPAWRGVKAGGVFRSVQVVLFATTFQLPDESSRIEFTLQPGVRQDGTEILQLTVTAVGKPAAQDDQTLLDWLDFGHLAVVNGFVQFTSLEAHRKWGKT